MKFVLTVSVSTLISMATATSAVAEEMINVPCDEYARLTGTSSACDIATTLKVPASQYQKDKRRADRRDCIKQWEAAYPQCVGKSFSVASDTPEECFDHPRSACDKPVPTPQPASEKRKTIGLW